MKATTTLPCCTIGPNLLGRSFVQSLTDLHTITFMLTHRTTIHTSQGAWWGGVYRNASNFVGSLWLRSTRPCCCCCLSCQALAEMPFVATSQRCWPLYECSGKVLPWRFRSSQLRNCLQWHGHLRGLHQNVGADVARNGLRQRAACFQAHVRLRDLPHQAPVRI